MNKKTKKYDFSIGSSASQNAAERIVQREMMEFKFVPAESFKRCCWALFVLYMYIHSVYKLCSMQTSKLQDAWLIGFSTRRTKSRLWSSIWNIKKLKPHRN